jgi:hypothetical protein
MTRSLATLRRATLFSLLARAGPLVALAGLAGCTFIGFAIGKKYDNSHAKRVTVEGWDLGRVTEGTHVRVYLRDGGRADGVFRGTAASAEEYAPRFERWRQAQAASARVPTIGDRVTIESHAGERWSARFLGFERLALVTSHDDGTAASPVSYRDIASVATIDGEAWDGSQLADLAAQGRVPLRSRLRLDKADVPLESVERLEAWRPGNAGKIIGAVVGAAVDILTIVAIAQTSSVSQPTYYSSCPRVYSFDGRRYALEGDVFPGAIFKASERMDRLPLAHLVASGGTYRLRVTNELDEMEYVDEMSLLVVDAPPGVRVVPTRDGQLRSLTGPVAPGRWTSLDGKAVDLAAGVPWVSGPFAGHPLAPDQTRDGLLLTFPRPPTARSVTLVVRAEPTPWSSFLLRQVLALQGRELPAWYAEMDRDPAARAAFLGALGREGQLALRLWNGTSWQGMGIVRSHEAVEVPIDAIPGDTLRLRLDSTPGLWSVEEAEADFGPNVPLDVIERRPTAARTARGRDVRGILRSADGQRLVLAPGDSFELVFAAPPPVEGRQRTVLIQAAGYYRVNVPAEGEPQRALFARLLRQPGALGTYARDLLRGDIERSLAASDRAPARAGVD